LAGFSRIASVFLVVGGDDTTDHAARAFQTNLLSWKKRMKFHPKM
jgi:hypothetical protein